MIRVIPEEKDKIIISGVLNWDKMHESSRRVYNPEGLAPTIPTCGGGGICPKIIVYDRGKS